MKTVDELMALADTYADSRGAEDCGGAPLDTIDALCDLLTALQESVRQIDTSTERVEKGLEIKHIGCVQHDCAECVARVAHYDEFATRGELAARFKCWHRLTREESDELVDLLRAQPVSQPLSVVQIMREFAAKDSVVDFARAIERAHGIGARLEGGV